MHVYQNIPVIQTSRVVIEKHRQPSFGFFLLFHWRLIPSLWL